MKKIFLVLAILLIATPVWAGVTIEAAQTGPNEVTVTYDMDDTDPNLVRAFALEISLTNDANIGPVSDVHPEYYVYPGSIVITGGVVTDYGTPVVVVDDSNIIIETGSLYAAEDPVHQTAPAPQGTLLKFTVSASCHVGLAENLLRGGVVLEDTTQETVVNFIECDVDVVTDCFPNAYTTFTDWQTYVANGWNADCWCAPPDGVGYQCDGDADNLTEGFPKYRVYMNDFNILVANWAKKMGPPGTGADPCADFDHKSEGFPKYRVYMNDFNILVGNWAKKDADLPGDCPRPE